MTSGARGAGATPGGPGDCAAILVEDQTLIYGPLAANLTVLKFGTVIVPRSPRFSRTELVQVAGLTGAVALVAVARLLGEVGGAARARHGQAHHRDRGDAAEPRAKRHIPYGELLGRGAEHSGQHVLGRGSTFQEVPCAPGGDERVSGGLGVIAPETVVRTGDTGLRSRGLGNGVPEHRRLRLRSGWPRARQWAELVENLRFVLL